MQGSQTIKSHASLKSESVWFKTKLVSQFLTLSFLLTQPFYLSYLHAAPIGGDIVGGTGSISQSDLTTTINQTSQNLAVNWQSFNVNTNEKVNFVQPNTSSISLNRILGNNGSVIQGQINANGQVILVNPNGVFFTPTATINVGGIVASSLDMTPSDFMNGNYIFNEVLGVDGAVVNNGLITASLGGNVALLGKQVKNEGLITAKLGSVVLAAGKQSVLTFDNQGLIGVKVTKEVLQEELGIEEAIVNDGEINAAGGRVLLTASTSQDVFSQAVNTNSLDQATSVVVNEDGTFTLGGGADVLNAGTIDVSSETNSENTARIILLGENITSSGIIKADTNNGIAGEIEIHANNKTLLTENSIASARALLSGQGGLIKLFGNKVGLFDNSLVDASGINDGGEVLIGGDQEGRNNLVRNAQFIYLSEQSQVKADATDSGDGGKVIAFAENSAKIHGQLFARGGVNGGNGGFIETSGLLGFQITSVPNASAFIGNNGTWLIDPFNISITGNTTGVDDDNGDFSFFDAIQSGAEVDVADIITGLSNGDVIIRTTRTDGDPDVGTQAGNITFNSDINFDGIGDTSTLTLDADNNIDTNTQDIRDESTGSADKLNIFFNADADNNGSGDVILDDSRIFTNGGSFTSTGQNFTSSRGSGGRFLDTRDKTNNTKGGDVNIFMQGDVDIGAEIFTGGGAVNVGDMRVAGSEIRPTSFINRNNGVIDTTGEDNIDGGDIIINVDNTVAADGTITINKELISDGGTAVAGTIGVNGRDAGAITLNATGNIGVNSKVDSNGSKGNRAGGVAEVTGWDGGNGNSVYITSSSGDISLTQEISTKGGDGHGDTDLGVDADPANGGNGGTISITTILGSIVVDKLTTTGGTGFGGAKFPGSDLAVFANGGNAAEINLTASTANQTIQLNNNIDASGGSFNDGGNSNPGRIGFGADITFTGDVVIGNNITIDSSGHTVFPTAVTTGHVWFKNTVSGLTDTNQDLDISATDVIFDGDVGTTTIHLGDLTIAASGDINASNNALFLKSLAVSSSNSFTSVAIDTSGLNIGTNGGVVTVNSATSTNIFSIDSRGGLRLTNGNGRSGGNIQINASDITVGEINTTAGDAVGNSNNGGIAGTIVLTALQNNTNISSVTLDGDIKAIGGQGTDSGGVLNGTFGTGQTASLTLNGLATDTGNAIINHTGGFTSAVNVTGNTDNDNLFGAAKVNTWNVTGNDDGDLNTQVTFTNVENLTGNNEQDDFKFNGGSLSGNIGGGVNLVNTVFNSITGDAISNTWLVDTNDDSGTVTSLGGRFSNIGNLIGNAGSDGFTINGDVKISGSIDGVGGLAGGTVAEDILKNSLTVNTISDNTWSISSTDAGSVSTGIIGGFSNIQKVKGGSGDDTFNVEVNGSLDLIEGGTDNFNTTVGDIVNFTALDNLDGESITLGTILTAIQTDINIDSVEQINTDAVADTNTIIGKDQDNSWVLTKADGGTFDTGTDNTVSFNNFTYLTGGSEDDTFTIGASGTLTGQINGLGENTSTGDQLDLSQRENIVLNVDNINGNSLSFTGGSVNHTNIETIVGNGTTSTVTGDDINTTWTITGTNSGSLKQTLTGGVRTTFSGFNNLTGGIGIDRFNFDATGDITGFVDGGTAITNDFVSMTTATALSKAFSLSSTLNSNATNLRNIENVLGDGTDTVPGLVKLIGPDSIGTNIWTITGIDDGTVLNPDDGKTVTFFNVSNMTGGDGNDTFKFNGAASTSKVTGLIDGGTGGSDEVDMSQLTGTISVDITGDINNIDNIKGNGSSSTLIGADFTSNWNIRGQNFGDIVFNDSAGALPDVTITFSGFNNLQGKDGINDSFKFFVGSDITGNIDGGDAGGVSSIDTADFSLIPNKRIIVGDALTGITEIEQVTGNSSTVLQGSSFSNTWLLDGTIDDGLNDGKVSFTDASSIIHELLFIDISKLEAGNANDSFTAENGGIFNGSIKGGTGNDDINIELTGIQTGLVSFDGSLGGINTLDITGDSDNGGGGTDYTGVFTSNVDLLKSDQFVYTDGTNVFTIKYAGVDTINDDLIASSLTVNGSSARDKITLRTNQFQVTTNFGLITQNDSEIVNYSGKTSLIVDGLANTTDIIDISAPITLGGTLSLRNGILTTAAAEFPLITANELLLDSISSTGTTINKKLNTDISHLSVINSGSLFVEDLSAVNIAELANSNANAELNIVALTGDITGLDRNVPAANADLISNGALSLDASTGSIALDGNNQLSGKLNLTTVNTENVRLNNTTSAILDTVTTQDLTVTTSGINSSISQFNSQSVIISDGLTRLSSTGIINLANAANDFTTISVDSSPSVTIQDSNRIGLNSVNATSTNITAADDIFDANGNTPGDNVSGSFLKLRSGTGIGITNILETNVANIDAITTSGQINIDNIRSVQLTNLVVTNGANINFNNTGDVKINRVDAGFGTRNPLAGGGNFNMDVTSGSVTAGPRININTAHITAFNTDILVPSGTFGNAGQPIVIKVNNEFKLFSLQSAVVPLNGLKPLIDSDSSTAKIAITDAFSNLAGQQLIEIESIGDIDPAIFTDVRNYNHSELALMMPSDQRYDISDEEDEEEKQNREKLINSTP